MARRLHERQRIAERLSERRVREAAESGADILAVCCPYEVSRFEDAAKSTGNDQLQVLDIVELIDEAMGSPKATDTMRVIDFGTATTLSQPDALACGVP